MAERKATNKYYPPDWDPSKGSVNKHKKSHPLRDRARKIDEGILVVRFEMPFNIWCLKCENHIGMGVRYNAEKSKVGNYYSSPIYKFRMKCRLCENYFEIQTDPSKFDYVILSGARKQILQSETDDGNRNEEDAKQGLSDAMFRLERKVEDKIQSEAKLPGLTELKEWRSKFEDSFAVNQLLRSQYRERRKRIERVKKERKGLPKSSPKIRALAKEMFNKSREDRLKLSEASKKEIILNSAIMNCAPDKGSAHSIKDGSSLKPSTSKTYDQKIKREPG